MMNLVFSPASHISSSSFPLHFNNVVYELYDFLFYQKIVHTDYYIIVILLPSSRISILHLSSFLLWRWKLMQGRVVQTVNKYKK